MKKISNEERFDTLINHLATCYKDVKRDGYKFFKGNRSIRVVYSPFSKDNRLTIRHKGDEFFIPVNRKSVADYEGIKDAISRALRIKR